MASRLPLRRLRSIPGFLCDTLAIRRQLAHAHGMVGYALDAERARKTFWTFSVWEDQASLDASAASDPHREITRRLQPLMGQTRFEFFHLTDDARLERYQARTVEISAEAELREVEGEMIAPGRSLTVSVRPGALKVLVAA